MAGKLYVVATPIGNLADLSSRARQTLDAVQLVLAEDTRRFGRLKQELGITTPCCSYHDNNELPRTKEALEKLQAGGDVALVSDAGTPAISDPGYRIINACREAGIQVLTVPGPCAAIAALSISGFEIERFHFEGFLPQKPGKRQTRLQEILDSNITSVLYESPHKVAKTLRQIEDIDPNRELFIGRELTKLHEETLHGTAAQLRATLEARDAIKGEFVLVVRRNCTQ